MCVELLTHHLCGNRVRYIRVLISDTHSNHELLTKRKELVRKKYMEIDTDIKLKKLLIGKISLLL